MAQPPKTKWTGKGPRALAALPAKIAEPAVRRQGFSAIEVVTRWPEIVGESLAESCTPERISYPRGARMDGTLHVSASGAMALELQHMEPVLIERINNFCGYRAVGKIAIKQAQPVRRRKPAARRLPAPPDAARLAQIESQTEKISDDELRKALTRLGCLLEIDGKSRK